MKTKEVTISNIKFNLSTEPLVSEPEVYPDYPSVPVNQITNKLITNLINYLPDYPWYEYIYNSNDQFDENLPDYYYEISVTDVEGYTPTFIEYYAWDEDEDGPIPGIKLFKDFNIYLERKYCEY